MHRCGRIFGQDKWTHPSSAHDTQPTLQLTFHETSKQLGIRMVRKRSGIKNGRPQLFIVCAFFFKVQRLEKTIFTRTRDSPQAFYRRRQSSPASCTSLWCCWFQLLDALGTDGIATDARQAICNGKRSQVLNRHRLESPRVKVHRSNRPSQFFLE